MNLAAIISVLTFTSCVLIETAMSKVVPTLSSAKQINDVLTSFIGKGDKLALFLDYDGTLSPIVSHPSLAKINKKSKAALKKLASNRDAYLAIVSGRLAEDAREMVKLDKITYAGNHGLEIIFRNESTHDYEIDEETRQKFKGLVTELDKELGNNGAWVENKKHSLTLHYRDVPEDDQPTYAARATEIIKSHGFKANGGKKAVEGKPPVNWNKGEAILFIMRAEFGDDWREKVKVIFAGDDTTDEDAMKALKGVGLTFRVSERPDIDTNADYVVPSTKTIAMVLQSLQEKMKQGIMTKIFEIGQKLIKNLKLD